MVVHNEPPPGSRQGQTSPVPIFFKNQSPTTSPFPPPKKQFAFREPYLWADSLRFHHFMFFNLQAYTDCSFDRRISVPCEAFDSASG